MSTSIQIYRAIKESCLSNPEIKEFGLWNNQVDKSKDGIIQSIRYPFIGVQFENEYSQLSNGHELIEGIFVIRICMQSLKHKDEDILLLKDKVHRSIIINVPTYGISNLKRIGEVQDTDFDNLIIWTTEYQFTYEDNTGADGLGTSVFPWSGNTLTGYY